MKRLVCEMCGGSDLVKQDGVFVCQNCGTKYSVEEAKKMMVEGTVSVEGTVAVEGTVKVDKSEELKKLYTLARRAKDSDNTDNAVRYYTQIEMQDPDSWEAYFYLIYFKARTSKKGEIDKVIKDLSNCFKTTMQLMHEAHLDESVTAENLQMIQKDMKVISEILAYTIMDLSPNAYNDINEVKEIVFRRRDLFAMIENLGDTIIDVFNNYHDIAVEVWKTEIDIFRSILSIAGDKNDLQNVINKIYEIDPSYNDPFGFTEKLRRKETFITCPKCGKKMREREAKCPQCGASKEEIQRLIKEQEERDAAERERIRKEREAKEAEEARIRAERRAEWWQQNGKKVIRAAIISVALLVLIIVGLKTAQAITNKRAISKAEAIIEQADALIATYQFDEAQKICESGLRNINNEEARHIVLAKETDIRNATNKADAEYESALKKLKILLDADDNVFNKYSNECLDKMIKIYPKRKETFYYKNLSNKANGKIATINPQKYESEGDQLFAQAKYEKASNKYNAAIIVQGETPSLKQKRAKCAECVSLLEKAQTAEKESRYNDAIKHYSDLYAIHSFAGYQSKVNAMKQKLQQIELRHKQGTLGSSIRWELNDGVFTIGGKGAIRVNDGQSFPWENYKNRIKSVVIENGITQIGYFAFADCKQLKSVIIPNSVTSIEQMAFSWCSSLTSISIPNSVVSIGGNAFCYCTSLKSLIIPNSVTIIEGRAFAGCEKLTSVNLSNGIKNIPNQAFKDCENLSSINIPYGVTTIEGDAFQNCYNLTSVTIPNSVTIIGGVCFLGL